MNETAPTAPAALSLPDYLRTLDGVYDVHPVKVTIDLVDYEACRYRRVGHAPAGSRAWLEARAVGTDDLYTEEAIYVVGPLPACYLRSKRIAFTLSGDHREWYLASYMLAASITEQNAQYHPFGTMFMLMPWEVPDGGQIDRWAHHPYRRIPLAVTALAS
jgi:hypothetical protein